MTDNEVATNIAVHIIRGIKAAAILLAWLVFNVTSCNMYGYYLDRNHPKRPSIHELSNINDRDEWAYEVRLKELQLEQIKHLNPQHQTIIIEDEE